jgi:hypothetical protein
MESQHTNSVCPSCGYCPHCGRQNLSPWVYPYPYYIPNIAPYVQPYWGTIAVGGNMSPTITGIQTFSTGS